MTPEAPDFIVELIYHLICFQMHLNGNFKNDEDNHDELDLVPQKGFQSHCHLGFWI